MADVLREPFSGSALALHLRSATASTTTGDGFGELSRYDEDASGWID